MPLKQGLAIFQTSLQRLIKTPTLFLRTLGQSEIIGFSELLMVMELMDIMLVIM